MVLTSVKYTFSQTFSVPAREAFRWAVNYQPGDFALMGVHGKREIIKLSDDSYILKETLHHGTARTRSKLIRIDPVRMLYTNTHITGPAKHSQFIYEIVPEGENRSKLQFTGLLLYRSERKLTKKEIARVASEERKFDSDIWKRLARAMKADLRN